MYNAPVGLLQFQSLLTEASHFISNRITSVYKGIYIYHAFYRRDIPRLSTNRNERAVRLASSVLVSPYWRSAITPRLE